MSPQQEHFELLLSLLLSVNEMRSLYVNLAEIIHKWKSKKYAIVNNRKLELFAGCN